MPRLLTLSHNVRAVLDTIAYAEIGPWMLAAPASDNGYRILVGSLPGVLHLMTSYKAHPLPDDSDAIEYAPGVWSTAAGRYQILNTYWPHYRDLLGLPDFSPTSQDRYAVQQLKEQDALEPLGRCDLRTAIARCSNIWASLPGNDYGQPTHDYDTLAQAYVNAGGVIWDAEAINWRIET